MLTALNGQLLVTFIWFQFVINCCAFSYTGRNLWFYVEEPAPFKQSIPELFLIFSIALSVFAVAAVIGGTRRTPRIWKRILPIAIFSSVAIWFSSLILNCRHFSYRQALLLREERLDDYYRDLATHHAEEDTNRSYWLDRDLRGLAEMDATIFSYEEKYQLPHAIVYPLTHPEVPR